MNLFSSEDYLEYLQAQIRAPGRPRGYLTALAKAAGCQRSYLSQVLKGTVHFTPEHALRIGAFWNLNEAESEYFLQLVHLGRTSFPPLKKKIRSRLASLRAESADLTKRYTQTAIGDVRSQLFYYSSWIPGAIHILVAIERFRTLEAIAERLGIPKRTALSYLEKLEKASLVKRHGQSWQHAGPGLHLSKDSPMNLMNHQNWRARAILDAQEPESDGIHYTAVQALSSEDFVALREMILKFLDQQRKVVAPSPSEELACFTCDWFRV